MKPYADFKHGGLKNDNIHKKSIKSSMLLGGKIVWWFHPWFESSTVETYRYSITYWLHHKSKTKHLSVHSFIKHVVRMHICKTVESFKIMSKEWYLSSNTIATNCHFWFYWQNWKAMFIKITNHILLIFKLHV